MENVRHGAEIVAALTKYIERLGLYYDNGSQGRVNGYRGLNEGQRPSLPHQKSATSSSAVNLAKRLTSSLYHPRASLDGYASTSNDGDSSISASSLAKRSASDGAASGKVHGDFNSTAIVIGSISDGLIEDYKLQHKMLFDLLSTSEFKAYGLEFLRDYQGVPLPSSTVPSALSRSLPRSSSASSFSFSSGDEGPSVVIAATTTTAKGMESPFFAATNLFWHWTIIQEGDQPADRWMEDPPKEEDFLVKRQKSREQQKQQQQQQQSGKSRSKTMEGGKNKQRPVKKLTKVKNKSIISTPSPPMPPSLRSATGSVSSIASTRRSLSSRLRFSESLEDDEDGFGDGGGEYAGESGRQTNHRSHSNSKSTTGSVSGGDFLEMEPRMRPSASQSTLTPNALRGGEVGGVRYASSDTSPVLPGTAAAAARRRRSTKSNMGEKRAQLAKMKADWELSDHLLRFVLLCFRFVNQNDVFRKHFQTWEWSLKGLFRFFLGVLRLLIVRKRNQDEEDEK